MHMTMRKKITVLFIFFALIPIVIIYLVASKLFLDSAQKDMENIYAANITEISKNIDGYFQDALDLTLYPLMEANLKSFLTTPQDSPAYQMSKQQASEILLTMPFGFSTGIHGFTIYNGSGDSISTLASVKISPSEATILNEENSSPVWDYSESGKKNGYLYLSRLLKNPTNISHRIGYIKVALSITELRCAVEELQYDQQTSYYLMAPDSSLILALDASDSPKKKTDSYTYDSLCRLTVQGAHSQTQNRQILSVDTVSDTGLLLFSVSNASALSLIRNTFTTTLAILSLLVLVFTILLSFAFSRIITRPLNQLGTQMASISNEDFSVRFPAKGNDEISLLAGQFNHMAERLGFLYQEVYMGELKLKQSQLDTLQTQINPHFLYNTLDTIYWMSKMGDTENVSTMVSNMSQMMRLTLTPSSSGLHTLGQEISHLNCYLAIQRIRYGKKVDFEFICPESLYSCQVLCLLLQPLVENALVHGLQNTIHGIVRISIFEENNMLIYEVANTGEPICPDALDLLLADTESREKRGMALRNINGRLILKYGPEYHLTYYLKGNFSIFKIRQPKEVMKNDEDNNCR